MLVDAAARASSDAQARNLLREVQGIVFYAVPHRGSPLAATASSLAGYLLFPSVEVGLLAHGSHELEDLDMAFR